MARRSVPIEEKIETQKEMVSKAKGNIQQYPDWNEDEFYYE